jgi:hypothetical protein
VTRATVAVVIAIAGASARTATQQPATGSLCILPHVKQEASIGGSPEVPPAAKRYDLRLDDGRWVPLSSDTRVLLAAVPLAGRHRVDIRGDGKPFSVFRFTFDRIPVVDGMRGCLMQNDLYMVWQFHPSTTRVKACRCTGVEPSPWTPAATIK